MFPEEPTQKRQKMADRSQSPDTDQDPQVEEELKQAPLKAARVEPHTSSERHLVDLDSGLLPQIGDVPTAEEKMAAIRHIVREILGKSNLPFDVTQVISPGSEVPDSDPKVSWVIRFRPSRDTSQVGYAHRMLNFFIILGTSGYFRESSLLSKQSCVVSQLDISLFKECQGAIGLVARDIWTESRNQDLIDYIEYAVRTARSQMATYDLMNQDWHYKPNLTIEELDCILHNLKLAYNTCLELSLEGRKELSPKAIHKDFNDGIRIKMHSLIKLLGLDPNEMDGNDILPSLVAVIKVLEGKQNELRLRISAAVLPYASVFPLPTASQTGAENQIPANSDHPDQMQIDQTKAEEELDKQVSAISLGQSSV